jgi:hypothetical protein
MVFEDEFEVFSTSKNNHRILLHGYTRRNATGDFAIQEIFGPSSCFIYPNFYSRFLYLAMGFLFGDISMMDCSCFSQ